MLNQFNADKQAEKRKESIQRTMERYQGTMALMAEWEQCVEPDHAYMRSLRVKASKLRTQLKMKGLLMNGEEETKSLNELPSHL